MARTGDDTWDPATSVGATATMVAAHRAAATNRADAVINDPFAEPLVRAVGLEMFSRLARGELDQVEARELFGPMTDVFAARTRFFDEFMTEAGEAGIRQVVIVASGLDSRAYRLPWPAGTVVYEVDQPPVIEFKTATLSELGATPSAELRAVGVDLRQDWPSALRRAGFDPQQPTVWLAEGLLIGFLPPNAQDDLVRVVSALSAAGSRFACDYLSSGGQSEAAQEQMRGMADRWRQHGLDLNMAELTFSGDRMDVAEQLRSLGWEAVRFSTEDLLAASAVPVMHGDELATFDWIVYVRAAR